MHVLCKTLDANHLAIQTMHLRQQGGNALQAAAARVHAAYEPLVATNSRYAGNASVQTHLRRVVRQTDINTVSDSRQQCNAKQLPEHQACYSHRTLQEHN
jgi:hypothetical protein